MTLHILNAKFKIPAPPKKTKRLSRKRVARILNEAAGYKVTLISAPAGYGKTFALSQWARSRNDDVAWVSLEASDDEPVRLYFYFKKMLKRVGASVEDEENFLSRYPVQSIQTNLTLMLNSLSEAPPPFFLVLDDYHHIRNSSAQRMLEFLIQYLPASIHLILSTRLDPPIALDRMRVENQLLEIRADRLSFTPKETARYLNRNLGLRLPDKVIADLTAKTEGWVAGVHIAALLLRNRSDAAEVIAHYSGNHVHVMAYLVREAYLTQPKHIQRFLLNTAVLDHLSPGLCNAVTAGRDGDSTLRYLIANNLFTTQVDEQGNWYRYHNLFSEALQNLLRQESADLIPTLYHRAGRWYEQNGYPDEAIRYAILAEDISRAVMLIEAYAAKALKLGERFTVRKWLEELPEDLPDNRPILGVLHAWALMNDKTAAADEMFNRRLDRAEKRIKAKVCEGQKPGGVLHTTFSPEDLMEIITLLRAIFAFERGLPSKLFVERLQTATGRRNTGADEFRSIALYLTGRIELRTLDYESALCTFDEAIPTAKLRGYYFMEVYTTYLKAWILFQQGKYHPALHLCRSTLEALHRSGHAKRYGTTIAQALHIIIGAVYFEWHCLEDACNCLERAVASLRRSTEVGIVAHGLIRLALVKIAMHKTASEVKSLLTELEALGRCHRRIVPLAEAVQMKLSAQLGNFPLALNHSEKMAQLLGAEENIHTRELTYYQNLDWQVTRTLVTIQVYVKHNLRPGKAMESDTRNLIRHYLLRWLEIVEGLGLNRLKIEILVATAGLMAAGNHLAEAMEALEKALDLAAPQEAVRPFIDHGQWIMVPLKKISAQQRYTAFIHTIFSKFPPRASVLIDPLSCREQEVLQLIARGLSNQGISTTLDISPNTVKTHISSIYGKLGVNKRTQAISRAGEIGLL